MKNKNLSGGLFAARPTPLTIKETPLSARIAEWLDSRGIYNDRLNCGKVETKRGNWITLCKTGTPDRFCIVRGQIVFIEVKRFGETATDEQLAKHDELRTHGAIVIETASFDNFVQQFNAIRAAIESARKGVNLYD
jgi:hypothetical protein